MYMMYMCTQLCTWARLPDLRQLLRHLSLTGRSSRLPIDNESIPAEKHLFVLH